MSWRGVDGGVAAARAGHDAVMAPQAYTYFDHYQSENRDAEPMANKGVTVLLETAYGYEPIPAALEPQFARHILGAQGQLWSEFLKTPKHVEYMAFPRLSALAEVVWTPASEKDFAGFTTRLNVHLQRLAILDVKYRAPSR